MLYIQDHHLTCSFISTRIDILNSCLWSQDRQMCFSVGEFIDRIGTSRVSTLAWVQMMHSRILITYSLRCGSHRKTLEVSVHDDLCDAAALVRSNAQQCLAS